MKKILIFFLSLLFIVLVTSSCVAERIIGEILYDSNYIYNGGARPWGYYPQQSPYSYKSPGYYQGYYRAQFEYRRTLLNTVPLYQPPARRRTIFLRN